MKIVDTLKGAKPFLTDGRDGWKAHCICYAITDYVGSIYGKGQTYSENCEAYTIRDAAQRHVMQELAKLTDDCMFNYKAAAKVLGREENLDLQQARHLWLDQLIQELENGTN